MSPWPLENKLQTTTQSHRFISFESDNMADSNTIKTQTDQTEASSSSLKTYATGNRICRTAEFDTFHNRCIFFII